MELWGAEARIGLVYKFCFYNTRLPDNVRYVLHAISAKSAASLSDESLRLFVLYKAIFTKNKESLRLLSLQVHNFWMDKNTDTFI